MVRITQLGKLEAQRISLGVSYIYLNDQHIDTFYGEQFAVGHTLDEWKQYIEAGGDPLAKPETTMEHIGLEAR